MTADSDQWPRAATNDVQHPALDNITTSPLPPGTQAGAPEAATPDTPGGMHKGLTSYGDTGFSLFLRKAFIKGAGFTDAALERPVTGIASASAAVMVSRAEGQTSA